MSTATLDRPFGLTRAVPAALNARDAAPAGLHLCPRRQIAVLGDGSPYIHAPHMATQIQTTYQTREDTQIWTDDGGTDND